MTKFNSATLTKLNKFATATANQIKFGITHGLIGSSGNDVKSEVTQFLKLYKDNLSYDHHVNVSNILKTPKQLKFVVGSIAWKIKDVA